MTTMQKMQVLKTTDDKLKLNLTSTAKGMLDKFVSEDDEFYYKSGFKDMYGWYENESVIAECVAFELGKSLGLDVLEQKLVSIDDILYCKSKNFLGDKEVLLTFAKLKIDTYEQMFNKLPEHIEYFNSIFIFDFIINNIDRHLNNIGLIMCKDGSFKEPPIFDNGSSLYYNLAVDQLNYVTKNPYGYKKFDFAKPFRTSHYKQIKLVENSGVLPKLNLDFDINSILRKYYKGERLIALQKLVKERMEYVKKIYQK